MRINIPENNQLVYLGRNGTGKLVGIKVFAIGSTRGSEGGYLDISPISSRGTDGRCAIEIPLGQVEEFIQMLRDSVTVFRAEEAQA